MFDPTRDERFYARGAWQYILERDVQEDEILMDGDKVYFLTASENQYHIFSLCGEMFSWCFGCSDLDMVVESYDRTVEVLNE